jgi:hypothetical protein
MSADGNEVFFDSFVPLVREDTNGRIDVYEWQRMGTDGCAHREGCVHVLSSGSSNDNSYLIGSSASGSDVFFISRGQLSPADKNEYYDVYDAREDGVLPLSEATCEGTGCQGAAPPPPRFATPASSTFSGGSGNFAPLATGPAVKRKLTRAQMLAKALAACRKVPKHRRARCRAAARHRYGPKTTRWPTPQQKHTTSVQKGR